jgi:hypothetical protein
MRMIEGGRSLSFPSEAHQNLTVFRDLLWKELERDLAVKSGVFGLVDHTHPADANFF